MEAAALLKMSEESNEGGNEGLSAIDLERVYKIFPHKSKQVVNRAIEQCMQEGTFNSTADLVVSLKRKLG